MQKGKQSVLKNGNIMLTATNHIQLLPKISIKSEPTCTFHLPPTPPSCSSSEESEDNITISQPSSPNSRKMVGRVVLNHHTTTRQPIHTPLISSQPVRNTFYSINYS